MIIFDVLPCLTSLLELLLKIELMLCKQLKIGIITDNDFCLC